jgi:uncharacterized protein
MTVSAIMAVILIIFIAAITRSTLGFGDALIGMPLLTLVIDIQVAAPVSLMVSMTIAVFILAQNWRNVDVRIASRLIIPAFIGIPVGVFILKNAPEAIVLFILGVILILYGLYNLFVPLLSKQKTEEKSKSTHDNLAYVFGFISGVLGGAYNTSGPPVVVYGTMRKWHPDIFRTTLQSYFLPTGIFTMIGHAIGGLWTHPVLSLYVYVLPAVLLSIVIGGWLSRCIPIAFFSKLIYGFLVLMGVLMVVRVF